MAKSLERGGDGSPASRLERLFQSDQIALALQHLAPETLHQLIRHRGLDGCSPILALATPAQLASVLDLDLWRSRTPGADEQFDGQRFGEWLEALVEWDDASAARIVSGLDARLVIAGLSRYIKVFDPATCIRAGWSDNEELEQAASSFRGFESEIGGYLVRGRASDAWDAVVTLLVALEADHPDCFHAVMRGCRRLSNSAPEDDGLDELRGEAEQLLLDVRLERQRRQSQRGYLTPADARAFLQMAGRAPNESDSTSRVTNPIAARYLQGGARADRSCQLAFLANALSAGCSVQSRPFTLQEAADAALATCHLGLELSAERPPGVQAALPAGAFNALVPGGLPRDHDLIAVFTVGWAALHELSVFAAARLIAILDDLRCADTATQLGLHILRQSLARRDPRAPWRAADALDVIATIDVAAWTALLGVFSECPVLPAALRATLERRKGPVSASAFEFISSARQVREVLAFLDRLLEILLA